MNIEIADGINIDELKDKPITVVCAITTDEAGTPILRALHPHRVSRRRNGGFNLTRTDLLMRKARS